MQAIRESLIVNENRNVTINIPIEYGNEVQVFIIPKGVHARFLEIPDESYYMMKLQEGTGFVKNILNEESEDIWNDL